MKKIVLKLDYADEKIKQKAMQKISGLSGLESISFDSKAKKLTVTGDIDPVDVVEKLRKLCPSDIISVGPAKEPEKKKEDTKKEEQKKDGDKKDGVKVELPPWMKAYQAQNNYPNYYQPYQQALVAVPPASAPPQYYSKAIMEEEDPKVCVIC